MLFRSGTERQPHYLVASRMVPYKRIPLVVEAFAAMPQRRLRVVGDGPDMPRVRALAAAHPNIEVLGYLSSAALAEEMGKARAFVFAAEEDFGITPVEVQACGTPVIAFGAGGAVETVVDHPDPARRTGVLFDAQTVPAVVSAVARFEQLQAEGGFDPQVCRRHAERFSVDAFRAGLLLAARQAMAAHRSSAQHGLARLAAGGLP